VALELLYAANPAADAVRQSLLAARMRRDRWQAMERTLARLQAQRAALDA
jgi:hypothetical protein